MTDSLRPAPAQDKPPSQRPDHPAFWDTRFDAGTIPWDAGLVPTQFAQYLETAGTAPQAPGTAAPATLIPGCGSAYEAALLADRGWPVTALDFSAAAIARARTLLLSASAPPRPSLTLEEGDFFLHQPAAPYQLIYERAFLCAIPRKLWPGYGQHCARLLAPGGHLAGYFLLGDELKGPPFPIQWADLEALLSPHFQLLEDSPVPDSVTVFSGRERWMIWQRR